MNLNVNSDELKTISKNLDKYLNSDSTCLASCIYNFKKIIDSDLNNAVWDSMEATSFRIKMESYKRFLDDFYNGLVCYKDIIDEYNKKYSDTDENLSNKKIC